MKRATNNQVAEIWKAAEAAKAARADAMPTEKEALDVMFEAYQRLQELGWREAIYCPKDGSPFLAIEAGSTGIHDCAYIGEWPTGSWEIIEADDLWPSRPILFKPIPPESVTPATPSDQNGVPTVCDESPVAQTVENGDTLK